LPIIYRIGRLFLNSKNKAIEGIFKGIGYEGVFSLEFLIDENDDMVFRREL